MIRFRRLTRALMLVAALSSVPALRAQDTVAAASAQPAAPPASGLPEGMGVPRTLRAYQHVFIAFSVAWLLVFGYTLTVGRRFKRLEEQVETLRKS